MSKYVIVTFPDEAQAYEGLRAINDLHREGSLTVYGSAIVQRDASGKLEVKQQAEPGPLGMGAGALVGALVGLFGGPVGAAVGFGGGALLGGLADVLNLGLGADFVSTVARELGPGKTALLAEVAEEWITPLDTRMEGLGGTVLRQPRYDFAEERAQKSAEAHQRDLAQRKAERAGAKADKMERMQAPEEQAANAPSDVRSRIEERISEMRADQERRMARLDQAWRLTREALRA